MYTISQHDTLHNITQPQYEQNVTQNNDDPQQQPILGQYTEDESSKLVNMPSQIVSGVPAQLIISRTQHDTLHNVTQPQYEQNVTQNIDTQITQPTQQQQTPSNLSSAKTQKTTIRSLFRSYRT
ncbi:unnamed protein product [Colias eurytheme]|nr:unnamed protein product [Colias eurytheme]